MSETILVERRAVNPISFVYVEGRTPTGEQHFWRLMYAHDDAHRAALEALGALSGLDPGWRIHEAAVFNEEPRRFRAEPVVRRTLEPRELR